MMPELQLQDLDKQPIHVDLPDRAILRWRAARSKITPDPEIGPNSGLVDP